jgi:signal transduction histidine kinase
LLVLTKKLNIWGNIIAPERMALNNKQSNNSEDAQQTIFLLQRKIEELEGSLQKTILEKVEKSLAGERLLLLESQQTAMEELVGNIAHQWRQPLNIVGLTVQKLQFDFEKNEVDDRYLDELVREVIDILKQMSRTVQTFRNFMQSESRKQQFNLNETIRQVLSFVDDSMKSAGIEVRLHAPHEDLMVNNFRNELTRIVLGMLNKSKKILQQSKTDSPGIDLHIFRENRRCVLTISDNGGCIPEQEIGKVFEPYSDSGTRGAGTGMELHMAKTVIERKMKGKLKVRNGDGGVEFRIEL